MHRLFGGDGGLCLSRRNGTQCDKEFVVNSSGIVQQGADDFLNAAFAVVREQSGCIIVRRELGFGPIGNRKTSMWCEAPLCRALVFELEEQVVDVSGHADAAAFARIIPFDGDTCKFVAGHVELNFVVLLENIE
jgi:hypothetical protein